MEGVLTFRQLDHREPVPRGITSLAAPDAVERSGPDNCAWCLSTSLHSHDNGATEEELKEAITHLAFYAGWPKAMSAMALAKQVFQPH